MKKFSFFILLALCFSAFVSPPSFLDKLAETFIQFNKKFPKESVYLQLDKNFYQSGDSLWFKGYVLNKTTRNLSGLSNTLTTYLINEKGKQVLQQEYLIIDGQVNGVIDLPKDLDKGYYKLVAFTSWMRNYNIEEVFTKDILVKEYTPPTNYFKISFNKKQYQAGEGGTFKVVSLTSKGKPVERIRFGYEIHIGNRAIFRSESPTSTDGEVTLHFSLPKVIDSLPTIKIFSKEKDPFNELFSVIPTNYLPKIDLQFFPEGGDAIANLNNKIAFKAVNELSQPVNLKGEVLDSKGNLITKIESKNLGMGAFTFVPKSNENYSVRITEPQGYETTYQLPEIKSEGYILSVENTNPNFASVNIKSSEKGVLKKGYLAMQMQGTLVYTNDVELTDSTSLVIPSNLFPMGVAQLTFFDEKEVPRAERLVFLNKNKRVNISVENLNDKYKSREQVSLKIKATDENGEPTQAVLSLAVVDSLLGLSDNAEYENIFVSMVFRPYLKGKIYNANSYFENSKNADESMDLLMLTQGWRRLEWKEFTSDKIMNLPKPINYEIVSGTVFKGSSKKKPASKAVITLVQLGGKSFDSFNANEDGHFSFIPKYDSYNSSQFILFAKSNNGKEDVSLVIDENKEDIFAAKIPNLFSAYSYDALRRVGVKNNPDDNPILDRDPHFDANTFLLTSVAIRAKYKDEDPVVDALAHPIFTTTKKGDELKDGGTFLDVLRQIISVNDYDATSGRVRIVRISDIPATYNDTIFYIKGRSSISDTTSRTFHIPFYDCLCASFVVDGVDFGKDYRKLDFLTVDNIKTVKVIKNSMMAGLVSTDAIAGVVYVTTKKGVVTTRVTKNVSVPQTKNYEFVREFYTPKYDTEKEKNKPDFDVRTTIHWQPFIHIGDSGETVVTFYNSDITGKAVGTIEGIGASGRLASHKFRYEVVKK